MKPKNKYKQIGLYIFYGALTIFLLSTILAFQDINEIFKVIASVDIPNLMWAILLLLAYLALYPITACILIKSRKLNVSLSKTYVIGMTEHFFNGITPFSTGGQPFQVYAFTKAGIQPEESTGVLLINFIIHMTVTNIFAILSLFYFPQFAANNQAMYIIAIIGFTMNFLVLGFMVALGTSQKLCNCLIALTKKLARIKFLNKFLTPRIPRIEEYFYNTQTAFKKLSQDKIAFLSCILIRGVTMLIYYSITFFILRALHINIGIDQFFFVICGTSFAITMVVFLPTPGSSGGIEYAFKNIFVSLSSATSTIAYSGMLLWRLLSYYLLMIISLLFYIGLQWFSSRQAKQIALVNAQTDQIQQSESSITQDQK